MVCGKSVCVDYFARPVIKALRGGATKFAFPTHAVIAAPPISYNEGFREQARCP